MDDASWTSPDEVLRLLEEASRSHLLLEVPPPRKTAKLRAPAASSPRHDVARLTPRTIASSPPATSDKFPPQVARFVRHAYRGKPALPIEVPPLELCLIYAGGGAEEAPAVCRKLDHALRAASAEAVSLQLSRQSSQLPV